MRKKLLITLICISGFLRFTGVCAQEQRVNRSWADRLEYAGIAVEEPGYHVWGASPVIGPNGKTHLFVSRWPVEEGFGAWITHCEIARYVSDRPEGPFVFKEVVIRGTETDTWDRKSPHNPNVHRVNNQYVLLYIANSGGSRNKKVASQRIGMMIANSPEGPWKKAGDHGLILEPPTDSLIWSHGSVVGVNNPALFAHPDGRYFLYYKAMKKGDVRRMGVAIADKLEGPYVFHKEYLTGNDTEIEDGYAFFEDGKVCFLTTNNHQGEGYLWKSEDGLHFDIPVLGFDRIEHYVGSESVKNATILRGKKFERPQILMMDGKPRYLYVASGINITGGNTSCSCVLRIKNPGQFSTK
ncbi:glycoside hydrolase family protein [Saccharicrinis sp. GN24d3]|uniref:glycoside hydrolase family protein n=1 Tax=Saccharicrinis sp. GN24d3 TaxID=3458416 RepID=UPI00403527E3